jgi:hypothetical protein
MAAPHGVVNLNARVQNAQLRVGIVLSGLGLAAAVAINKRVGAGLGMHALLVPVLFVGAYGICAGLSRTCGLTAMAGRRWTATGPERIADRSELAALRRQGAAVVAGSLLFSVLAAALLSAIAR